jgi:hypothetical protein
MADSKDDTLKVWLLIALVVLPCIYLLSIGPAYRLHHRNAISYETYRTVYWPIRQACRVPLIDKLVSAYVNLWHRPGQTITRAMAGIGAAVGLMIAFSVVIYALSKWLLRRDRRNLGQYPYPIHNHRP